MKPGNSSASLRTKLIRTVLLACLILSLSPSVAHAQQTAVPKRILKLYWYDQDRSVTFHQSFQAALQSAPAGTVEYYPEYLESIRFPGENQSLLLHDYLRKKYANRTIDVVVASPDAPLNFLLRYRRDLFPTAPLVFSSVRRPSGDELAAGAGATGVIQLSTHRQTLDLALRLHPDTKQVLIIGGTLEHMKFETLAREALQGYESKVRFTYLTDLTPDELIAKTKSLPEKSIILYIWQQSVNKNGKPLESADLLALIAQSASVPIYGLAFTSLGHGIIGGYVSSTEAIATRVAEIALRIANGERAQDIPIENAPAVPAFDWRQLQRWGISEDKLPPGSIVSFKELTFWEQYKWRIVGVVTLCVLQGLLISILLVERVHRRRAKVALDERLRFETLLSELSAAFMSLRAPEVDLGMDVGLKRLGSFLGVDAGAFLELSTSDVRTSQPESNAAVVGDPPLARLPDEQRRWCMDRLRSGATINLSRVAEEIIGGNGSGNTGIKSLLAIPIASNGSVCALTFATTESYREWHEDLVPRLRLAGEIFATAVERKRNEQALTESEERYHAFFDLTAVGAGQASPEDGRLLRVNEAHCRITGHTREELLALRFSDITHPEDRDKDLEKFQRLIRGEIEQYTSEKRYLRKNGSPVWVQVDVTLVRDAQGRPLHTVAIIQDIHTRKQAQEALRESEERFRAMADTAPVLIWLSGTDKLCTYVNRPWLELTGRTLEQELGSGWAEGVHPDDYARCLNTYVTEFDARRAFHMEYRIRRHDGKYRWVLDTGVPRFTPDGAFSGYIGSAMDITERIEAEIDRKLAEDALRESEERYRNVVETQTELICRNLPDTTLTFVNDAYCRHFGRTREQLIGRKFLELIPAQFHAAVVEHIQSVVNSPGSETGEHEHQVVNADGTVGWQHWINRVIRDASGRVVEIQGSGRDVTERKRAEDELLQLSAQLLSLQDEERRRIARQLHDVTAQNLFAITINLGSLARKELPANLKDSLTESQALCEQALQEIRTLSYLLHPPMLDQVGLVAALQWYIDGFSKRSGIEVNLVVTQEITRLRRDMETDLFRVVQESLVNIHRHSGSETATVRLGQQADLLILQIEDQGRGIPKAVGTESEGESLGVGILGMRHRMRQLGGRLEVESTAGEGTTVRAIVPLLVERRLRARAGSSGN